MALYQFYYLASIRIDVKAGSLEEAQDIVDGGEFAHEKVAIEELRELEGVINLYTEDR